MFYLQIIFYYGTTVSYIIVEYLTICAFNNCKSIVINRTQSHSLVFVFLCIELIFLEAIGVVLSKASSISSEDKLKKSYSFK